MVVIITYNKSTAAYLKNFWEYLRLLRIITNVPKYRINVNNKINNYWLVQQLYLQDIWIQVSFIIMIILIIISNNKNVS